MFSAVFLFQVSPILKVLQKFQEKYRKNQRTGSFAKNQRWARGEPGEAQAATWRGPTPGRASGAPGAPALPLAAPLRIYIPLVPKPSRTEPFFAISPLFCRRNASKIGSIRRTLPGTLPEGRTTTMDASRMSRE